MDYVMVSSGKTVATTAAAALSSEDTRCAFVRVAAPAASGPASSNTDGVWVGNGSTLGVVIAPSNWTGEDVPCSSVGRINCKSMSGSQVVVWTAFSHR